MEIYGGGPCVVAGEENPHLAVPKRAELSYEEKADTVFRLLFDMPRVCQFQEQRAFTPYPSFYYDLENQCFIGGLVAQHTSSRDSGTTGVVDELCSDSSSNIDEMCTLEVVAAEKKVVLQPLTPKQDALKPLTPEQDALKPPTPEQDVPRSSAPDQDPLKPPTPEQGAQKCPALKKGFVDELCSGSSSNIDEMCTLEVVAAEKKMVPQPLTPKKDALKPLTPEQYMLKPPTPEQDALKPPAPEQDSLKLPAPEQDTLKLPAPEQGALKALVPEQCTLKHPTPEQDVLKPPTPDQDALKPPTLDQDALQPPTPKQGVPKRPAPKKDFLKHLTPRHMREKEWWIEDGQSRDLLALLANKNRVTQDEAVVKVLNMVRCREFIEYNPKTDRVVPTRFCQYNIAFFDLDKESVVVPRPPISKIPASNFWCLEDSVNVISIKVTESDVGYPIYVYGTILARDQYDYRCIYLFKRGMDNPQLIMSPDDMLTLAGPFRAFAVTGSMFFEFHLKIKRVGLVDQNLSKCLLEHNTSRHTCQPMVVSLKSCLSTIVMVYSPVSSGVEASVEINILNGPSSFTGKVTACTTESQGRMILYDSEVAGTRKELGTGGSVALTRSIVAVPLDECLVLDVAHETKCFEVTLCYEDDVEECTLLLGPYELQVKVTWTAIDRRRRPKMLEQIGDVDLLW